MPRDLPLNYPDTDLHPRHAEIAIVEEMERLLARKKDWCKEFLERDRLFRKPSHCLLGALNIMDHGDSRFVYRLGYVAMTSQAAEDVMERMKSMAGTSISSFNNAATTKHSDILALLARVKQSFRDETV